MKLKNIITKQAFFRWVLYMATSPRGFRHYGEWRRSQGDRQYLLNGEIPWIPYDAIDWLEKVLNKNKKVFEWGVGGSTLYFVKKGGELVSVEHDPDWFKKVKTKLSSKLDTRKKKHKFVLQKPQAINRFSPNNRKSYKSDASREYSFEKYCKVIDNFKDNYFDLVVVDGRARNSCISHAISKVKPGGFLLLDNSDRERYRAGIKLLDGWKRKNFFGPGPCNSYFWEATVFQKPR